MMKVNDFVNKAKEIANLPTVYYSVAGGEWAKWNGSKWNFDCVILIKAILWGWNGNKSASHGGAIYGSNGVYDDNADGIVRRFTTNSTDFSNIEVGEILHMPGHVGIYIGNRKVVEATMAWDQKVQISDIGKDGRRSRNGVGAGYWSNHGKISYVDYTQPVPTKTIDELAQEVIAGKWGNDPERKEALIKAGYDRDAIQARVNEIMNSNKTYYTVQKGDTLWGIAKKYYNDGSKYPVIAKANNIANPDIIHTGDKLLIP